MRLEGAVELHPLSMEAEMHPLSAAAGPAAGSRPGRADGRRRNAAAR